MLRLCLLSRDCFGHACFSHALFSLVFAGLRMLSFVRSLFCLFALYFTLLLLPIVPLALPLAQACLCNISFISLYFVWLSLHVLSFPFSNTCLFASFLLQVVLPVVSFCHAPPRSRMVLHPFTLAGHVLFIISFISCYSVLFLLVSIPLVLPFSFPSVLFYRLSSFVDRGRVSCSRSVPCWISSFGLLHVN